MVFRLVKNRSRKTELFSSLAAFADTQASTFELFFWVKEKLRCAFRKEGFGD
jgi:hypothetical protein